MVLWQVGAIGERSIVKSKSIWNRDGLRLLIEVLGRSYPPDHPVTLYEATILPVCGPEIVELPLAEVPDARVSVITTMYVPPLSAAPAVRPGPGTSTNGQQARTAGSLTIVGTGYAVSGQVTPETRWWIDNADKLFYLVTDTATSAWLRGRNVSAESLHDSYIEGESGLKASQRMAERIVDAVRAGHSVTAAFSGHPAILLETPHRARRMARAEGYPARMLPAVSFEDTLVADLGIDPAVDGRTLWEATMFLEREPITDPTSLLVLMQVGAIGEANYRSGTRPNRPGLEQLQESLARRYGLGHEAIVYECAQLPVLEPRVERPTIGDIANAPVSVRSTLVIPPLERRPANRERLRRLGIDSTADHEPAQR